MHEYAKLDISNYLKGIIKQNFSAFHQPETNTNIFFYKDELIFQCGCPPGNNTGIFPQKYT